MAQMTSGKVLRETRERKGYELDTTHYRVSVTEGGVASITVKERPTGGTLSLLKASANPPMTDDNPCYSLAGAEYHVYRDKACTAAASCSHPRTTSGHHDVE